MEWHKKPEPTQKSTAMKKSKFRFLWGEFFSLISFIVDFSLVFAYYKIHL